MVLCTFKSLQLIDRQNTFFSLHALLCPSIHILTHLPSHSPSPFSFLPSLCSLYPNPCTHHLTTCAGNLKFERNFNPDCKDLVKKLLNKDIKGRLGNLSGGTDDIRNHKWFKGRSPASNFSLLELLSYYNEHDNNNNNNNDNDEYTNLSFTSGSCSFYSYIPHFLFPSPSFTMLTIQDMIGMATPRRR
jgi:hypothetical protein